MLDLRLTQEDFDSAMVLLGAEHRDGEWVFDSPGERYALVWRPSDPGPEGTVMDTYGTEVVAEWEFALSGSMDPVLWLTGVILEYLPSEYFEYLREWATAYITSTLTHEYLYVADVDALRRAWDSAGLRFRITSEYGITSFEWPLVDRDDESIIFGMRSFDLNAVLNAYSRQDSSELDDWINDYAADIAKYLGIPSEADDWDDDDEGADDD